MIRSRKGTPDDCSGLWTSGIINKNKIIMQNCAFTRNLLKNLSSLSVGILILICQCSGQQKGEQGRMVKFFKDPKTNSVDPEIRMAYGLNIVPPWPDGGSVFLNLPEHLEYMPDTKGIARHHDNRLNVWQISNDSTEAKYSVESITEPGVFFEAKAKSKNNQAVFEFTITNRTNKTLHSIRPLFCFQYNPLHGFPAQNSDNFSHTYIIINGAPAKVSELAVRNKNAQARMAQAGSCADEHNWWAEKAGGMIEQKIDAAYTILTDTSDTRKIIVTWAPGKDFLSNSEIPCIHADPCIGNLEPGKSVTVTGALIFTSEGLQDIMKDYQKGKYPLQHNLDK